MAEDVPRDPVTIRRPTWWPTTADPDDTTKAHRRTAAHVRELVEALASAQPGEISRASLDSVSTVVADAVRLLTRDRVSGVEHPQGRPPPLQFETGPLSGACNPLAPPLDVWADGSQTHAVATYGAAHQGPVGHVHGGLVMAAFDDVLGVAQRASGAVGLTGTLTVRLVAPTPIARPITYEAWVEDRSGRRVEVRGVSRMGDVVLGEAVATFVSLGTDQSV